MLSLCLLILLTGCSKDPIEIKQSNNENVPVSLLFEHDWCKMYRFEDGGREHYYAKCGQASETITQQIHGCGKGCVVSRDENIRSE